MRLFPEAEKLAARMQKGQFTLEAEAVARGYALATRPDGSILTSADDIAPGDRLRLRLARGQLACRVEGRS